MFRLEDLIDADKFQKIQDDIAKAIDMALLTVDYKGVPFTGHSACQAYCTLVREVPQYRDLCQKCDSRGGLEAARLQRPYIYICHLGLVDLAVPIIINGQYLGAVMAGQVLLAEGENEDQLEQIVVKKVSTSDGEFERKIERLRANLPRMSLGKIEAIASMLFHINQYIVEEAILKASLTKWVEFDNHNDQGNAVPITSLNFEANTLPRPVPTAKEDLLKPAFQFMEQHVEERLYVEQMASLCNLSVSYFSKCFNKATGMSFSAYHNWLKIQKAEKLLQTSNRSVNQLSDDLGFDTPGYFIKLFKKQVGVTPAVYRQEYQLKTQVEYKNNHRD